MDCHSRDYCISYFVLPPVSDKTVRLVLSLGPVRKVGRRKRTGEVNIALFVLPIVDFFLSFIHALHPLQLLE